MLTDTDLQAIRSVIREELARRRPRRAADPIADALPAILEGRSAVTMAQLARAIGGRRTRALETRLGGMMRALGWEVVRGAWTPRQRFYARAPFSLEMVAMTREDADKFKAFLASDEARWPPAP